MAIYIYIFITLTIEIEVEIQVEVEGESFLSYPNSYPIPFGEKISFVYPSFVLYLFSYFLSIYQ